MLPIYGLYELVKTFTPSDEIWNDATDLVEKLYEILK